jgi:NAD(P)-dependent dehydrogenase (short-subunit alcohol dehydrogenase family)
MADVGMTTLALDVTKTDSIKTCHDEVSKLTGGKLDILVNNASVFPSLCLPSRERSSSISECKQSH